MKERVGSTTTFLLITRPNWPPTPTPARKWYAGGAHSKLTVNGKASDGTHAEVVLRGQINGRHVLNRGAPVNESSRVKFTFHKEDNPELPVSSYEISFPAYAQAWHSGKLIESFLVQGEIQVTE